MKKLKKLVSFIILIAVTVIIAVIYNQNLISTESTKTEAWEEGKLNIKLDSEGDNYDIILKKKDSYVKDCNTGNWSIRKGDSGIPISNDIGDASWYCAYKGKYSGTHYTSSVYLKGPKQERKVNYIFTENDDEKIGPWRIKRLSGDGEVVANYNYSEDKQNYIKPKEIAYILSSTIKDMKDSETWSLTKQAALWESLGWYSDDITTVYRDAKQLQKEAETYNQFVMSGNYNRYGTGTIKNVESTIKVEDYSNTQYKIGPFQLQYEQPEYTVNNYKLRFNGVSGISLIDKNDTNKTIVSKDKISLLMGNDFIKSVQYFPNSKEDMVEYEKKSNKFTTCNYPKSGKTFYVIVNKDDIADTSAIKVKATFAKVKCKTNFTFVIGDKNYSGQNQYQSGLIGKGERELIESPAYTDGIELTKFIKLSGYVWEDVKSGKETSLNGTKDGTNEAFLSGIKVVLHTSDGKTIGYVKNTESGSPTKYGQATKTTTTNSNGYYEFIVEQRSSGGYYVEFVYNGQNYQHTKYTQWSTTSSNAKKTSNATETESARDNLNKGLAEIGPNTGVSYSINTEKPSYISKYAISAYTGGYGNTKNIKTYNTTSSDINLGITKREVADLALRKDVYKAILNIKGYSQEYLYNKRDGLETDSKGNSYWDISLRKSDTNYYATSYTREVKKADYNYKGTNNLEARVVYKITIRNQSEGIAANVTELADYFDDDYTYEGAYIGDRNGKVITNLTSSSTSKYTHTTRISGYNKLYLKGLENSRIQPSGDLYVYVTFKVNTDSNGIKLDNSGTGKGNIAEIMGYKTYYANSISSPNAGSRITYTEYKAGNVAGRVDVDSNPGNVSSTDTKNFEDDTDRAPYIKFALANEERRTTGNIWIENRNNTVNGADIGNGSYDNGEAGLSGVKVELWDADTNQKAKMWTNSGWQDAQVTSGNNGDYTLSGFVPGNYYLKFIYADGQTYKSTIYNPSATFDVNNPDELGRYVETTQKYSDARDIYNGKLTDNGKTLETLSTQYRQYVNNLLTEETNGKLKEYETQDKSMQAVTGLIGINIEKNPNDRNSDPRTYRMDGIDFGVVERPKTQLTLSQEVANVKVTLANGNTLFDASGKATNVLWQAKKYHQVSYDGNKLKTPVVSQNPQRIVLTMDEELMQGATINVKYALKVTNVGEIDYTGYNFYYKGNVANGSLVRTTIKGVVNYIGAALSDDAKATKNNLRFDASNSENNGWEQVNFDYLYKGEAKPLVSEDLLTQSNGTYTGAVSEYSTILQNKMGETALTPQIASTGTHEANATLTLSQVMSAQNAADDLSYNTLAEIIKVSNDVGRRMAFSTVGNQNPNAKTAEIDADSTTVTVLPPFGETYIYYVLGLGLAVIIGLGVVLIKKKVINKK